MYTNSIFFLEIKHLGFSQIIWWIHSAYWNFFLPLLIKLAQKLLIHLWYTLCGYWDTAWIGESSSLWFNIVSCTLEIFHTFLYQIDTIDSLWIFTRSKDWMKYFLYQVYSLHLKDSEWKSSEGQGQGQGLIAQSCPTLCDPMDWGLPSSSVHMIL